jgi:hypothetical protein
MLTGGKRERKLNGLKSGRVVRQHPAGSGLKLRNHPHNGAPGALHCCAFLSSRMGFQVLGFA